MHCTGRAEICDFCILILNIASIKMLCLDLKLFLFVYFNLYQTVKDSIDDTAQFVIAI